MRILLLIVFSQLLPASELVILRNGVKLEVESRSEEGNTIFLLQKGGTTLILDRSDLALPTPAASVTIPVASTLTRDEDPSTIVVYNMINKAAARHGLPADLIHAVASMESGYQQKARSSQGAIGVMQLMPSTARYLGADPSDTAQNIDAGTRLLRTLLLKYEGNPNQLALALAAYNAGPGAVDRFGGVPPYVETRRYVDKVIRRFNEK